MLLGVLGKTFQLVGYIIQYGCIAHCAFEYVGVGHIWLEGGNLQNSTDSRYCGPILGRIFFKIWPLSDFGFLRASPNGHRFSDN
uniref:Peptidase S26 domain-containing protein n=1 Tax=Saimiri boliviensis boliviensis TaxID=39432 RepID=A0A2K6S557_SAIBB